MATDDTPKISVNTTGLDNAWGLLVQLAAALHENAQEMGRMQHHAPADLWTDPVTGLLNEHGLAHMIRQEEDRIANGFSHGAGLIVIDLDGLPKIMRQYGEEAINAYLKAASQTIRQDIRTMDAAARTGFYEIAVLMCNTDDDDICEKAQILAITLNRFCLIWSGMELASCVSVAVKPVGVRPAGPINSSPDPIGTASKKGLIKGKLPAARAP